MDSANVLNAVGDRIGALLGHSWVESLLIDGVWRGVASVLVFLPQILLLFLFIGVLEDSGYLARAALIADRVMRSIGLTGRPSSRCCRRMRARCRRSWRRERSKTSATGSRRFWWRRS